MLNLKRINNGWLISILDGDITQHKEFSVIEDAADFMLSKGIKDEAIDDALIAMATCSLEFGQSATASFFNGELDKLELI